MADDVMPVITPGEKTTEFAVQQNASWWGKAMMIAGVVLAVVPQVIDAIQHVPGVEQNKTFTIILAVLGILVTLAGTVKNMETSSAYITGRSTMKAAALRDAPQPPAEV